MATAQQVRRRYGFPVRGFVASRRKQVVDLNTITRSSHDWLISPNEGQLIRRMGTTYVGESDISAPAGLLEQFWTDSRAAVVPRRMLAVNGPTTGGQTHPFILAGAPDTAGPWGTVVVFNPATNTKYNFGEEFGNTHYPVSSNPGYCRFRMVPMPYLTPDSEWSAGAVTSSSVGLTRCAHAFARRHVAPGSREMFDSGDFLLLPNLYGTPMKWNKAYNASSGSGTEVLRAGPWGHWPPLAPPTKGSTVTASGSDDANWTEGDTFFVSVMFQMEDGSFTKPWVPRAPSSTLSAANGGLWTLGTIGGSGKFRSVQWDNLPIGPPGTRARVLLRTRKVRLTATDSPTLPDPARLYVAAVIENNTQTSYIDYGGNDDGLREDTLAVRWDHILPPAARTAFEFERRVGVGYSRKNPCAIFLAPTGATATRDLNVSDDNAGAYGTRAFCYRITKVDSVAAEFHWRMIVIATGVVTSGSVTLGGSLQALVDHINENASIANGAGEWKAQLAPGVDPNITSDKLQPTSIQLSNCQTTNGSNRVQDPSGTGRFADAAVGCRITGTGIPANTIVISKTNNNDIRIGSHAGAAVNATATSSTVTLTFSQNTGDDGLFTVGAGDNTVGNIRAFCPAFPAVIAFKGSYLDTLPRDTRSVYFTAAPPGQASAAVQSFFNSLANRRSVPSAAGAFLAGAPVGKRAVLCYTGGIYVLDNQRGGTTGEDFDFHPYPGNVSRGCINIRSVVAGNGWVGYLTRDGYIVADVVGDQLRERLLSGDLYDSAQGTPTLRGILDNMISDSGRYPDPDANQFGDSHTGSTLAARIVEGALHLLYRPSASGDRRRIVYDFRSGIEASGLAQVLRSIGADEQSAHTFGWSAPLRQALLDIVGPVYSGNTYAIANAGASGIPLPATGELLLVLVDRNAHIGRDDIYQFTVSVNFSASTNQLAAASTNGLRSLAVGARLTGHANLPANCTVLTKAPDGSAVTISGTTTNTSPVSNAFLTATGQEVEPVAYFAMDQVDVLREKKVAHRATTLHRCGSGEELHLGFARDRSRQTRITRQLKTSGTADNAEQVVEMPITSRAPAPVVEFSVEGRNASLGLSIADGGFPAEFWGLDADLELLDSPV